jgi:hypothetical protein
VLESENRASSAQRPHETADALHGSTGERRRLCKRAEPRDAVTSEADVRSHNAVSTRPPVGPDALTDRDRPLLAPDAVALP